MNLLNLILPTHTRLANAFSTGANGENGDSPGMAQDSDSVSSVPSCEQSPHLARFEPWLLGLRNMIEEGDWRSAQVFAEQINTRLRHLELESKCDAAGVVPRSAGL